MQKCIIISKKKKDFEGSKLKAKEFARSIRDHVALCPVWLFNIWRARCSKFRYYRLLIRQPNQKRFSNLNWLFTASWENCYLETVPAHAVMTKSGHTHNAQFKRLLLHLSMYYGKNQTNSSGFQLFVSSKYGGSDLLFKDSTKKLVDVGVKNTYRLWLGNDYLRDLEVLNSCPPSVEGFGEINKPQLAVVLVSLLSAVIAIFSARWMSTHVNHSPFSP